MSWNLYVLESLNTVEIQEWTNRRRKIDTSKLNGNHMFLHASCTQTQMIYHHNTDLHNMLIDYVSKTQGSWEVSTDVLQMQVFLAICVVGSYGDSLCYF